MKRRKRRLFQNRIYVQKSNKHGFGVFAGKRIKKGEKIEECYFILSRGGDKKLEDYYFDAKKGKDALFTGYGSIYNHATDPNADYTLNITKRIATIKAKRNIPKDEEIYISYGDDWFEDRGLKSKE